MKQKSEECLAASRKFNAHFNLTVSSDMVSDDIYHLLISLCEGETARVKADASKFVGVHGV